MKNLSIDLCRTPLRLNRVVDAPPTEAKTFR